MVQPIEGLVVSLPVLLDAQCAVVQPAETQQRLLALCPLVAPGQPERHIGDLATFLSELLGLTVDLFDQGDALADDLKLYVPEGGQTIRPTMALRKMTVEGEPATEPTDGEVTPARRAGATFTAPVWDVPEAIDNLDKPETHTGPWEYPAAAKFDRLLRECRVPIGILTNRRVVRLVYAPHGESTGAITFRLDDMATVGGRPILDAFVMLLGAPRWFGVAAEHQLPALLAESRKRQANVTNELAGQVFEALEILLRGFQAAAERDGSQLLDEAARREDDHLYGGLLTTLLRLVFVLYAEDRGLLPVEHDHYAEHLSLLGLFEQLREDHGAFPDSMNRRFGAYGRLLTLFRAIFLGARHESFEIPARRGDLFDPHRYPFLEGWGPAGSAPITQDTDRAAVRVPSVDDATVYGVLSKLIMLQGQRLSYRTLDVEQIGSVYEALMGYHVVRVEAPAVCIRPDRVWVTTGEVTEVAPAQRTKWIKETLGLSKAQADKLAEEVRAAKGEDAVLDALDGYRMKSTERARPGQLVIQPGSERRRTSSHYTPRSLSAPIVRRTLEPLLACMGKDPPAGRILNLKVCDPAMGSGAFLVEACRFLADQVVAAWTREGNLSKIADTNEDVVNHARRLVAQRCLYGVDKNPFAVGLAKLSLWLVTLAKDLPFTFLDHALRHGDSLVGLDFDQITAFHWTPTKQVELCKLELEAALSEAIGLRQKILDLATETDPILTREKERLLWDAEDALDRVRLLGDLVVGAFFAHQKDKDREKERTRRLDLVLAWLRSGGSVPDELRKMQAQSRARVPVFHWMAEYPEVFYAERPDPLEDDQVNRAAFMDAFVGNPPFLGGKMISTEHGDEYSDWLDADHAAGKNGDLSAHFFRRADCLLGRHGTIGLIATNTIAQGDTRATGLQHLARGGLVIYDATRSLLWPGDAAVAVAVVHIAKGRAAAGIDLRLGACRVPAICSRLRAKPERGDAEVLTSNIGFSFNGAFLMSMGFTLTPEERTALMLRNARNGDRILPYLGGEEVNTSPTQRFDRYVISFGQMSLEEAERWPDLIRIVREKVKPERDRQKDESGRRLWWQFFRSRPELNVALARLDRCLVTARVTKHLCFSFQPTDRVLNEKLYIFPLDRHTPFAVLQSRLHTAWTWLLSSTMKNDLNYSASDCFETFPFPRPDPRAVIPELEDIGQRLCDVRASYMADEQVGLTITYNRLKDPGCRKPRIEELRGLHEEMDRAVLAAYGWSDIPVPPFVTPATAVDKKALEAFEDEVIDRLFVLNAQRAEEERVKGLTGGKKTKSAKAAKGPRKKAVEAGQLELGKAPTDSGDK
jgi:hypothetical protein